jgi:hypothetical protein
MTNNLHILERLFRLECHTLAQYVSESWPWTHRGDQPAKDLVQSITADERRWAAQLFEILSQRGVVPLMGSYPEEFTRSNLHFVALDYLLRRIADYIERAIKLLRAELDVFPEDAPVRALLHQMIERKQGQVEALHKVAESAGKSKVAGH